MPPATSTSCTLASTANSTTVAFDDEESGLLFSAIVPFLLCFFHYVRLFFLLYVQFLFQVKQNYSIASTDIYSNEPFPIRIVPVVQTNILPFRCLCYVCIGFDPFVETENVIIIISDVVQLYKTYIHK
jgi:hypothetical protein